MESQGDITVGMRSVLIDWLVEVITEYGMTSDVLYLSVNYLDRFLSQQLVSKGKLQLLGIACLMVAS